MLKKKKTNYTLNILKAICCILIVFNHCTFPGLLGDLIKNYGRIAVPIFFMISGYYVNNNSLDKIKNKTIRIFKILAFSCLFWFIFTIIRDLIQNPIALKFYLLNFLDWKKEIKMFIFTQNVFWGHLWFINALLYAYIFEYFNQKKFHLKMKYAPYILLGLYVILNLTVITDDLENAYLIRNFIFVGIPFFYLGKNCTKYLPFNNRRDLIIIFILLFITLNIEILTYISELPVSSIILSIILFKLCLNYPSIRNKQLEYIGATLSMYIYIIHPAVKYVIIDIFKLINIHHGIILYIEPIIMLILVIIITHYYVIFLKKIKERSNEKCL